MLTFNVIDQRITGVIDGLSFNVAYAEATANSLKDLQVELESINDVDAYETWVAKVKDLLESTEVVDTIVAATKDLMHDTRTGNYYVKVGDKVSKHPVPMALVGVMLESAEKGIDPTPIVKAWVRFLRNPNFSTNKAELFARYITTTVVDEEEVDRLMEEEGYTEEKAMERSVYSDVTISESGLLVTKKYARLLTQGWVIDPETNEAVLEDLFKTTKTVNQFSGEVTETVNYPEFSEELTFEPPVMSRGGDAFLCGEIKDHIIKVGQYHTLDNWSQVNCNDNVTCTHGLHVGK